MKFAKLLSGLLLCVLLATPAGATLYHHHAAQIGGPVSPWAQAEVDRARELGFDFDYLLGNELEPDRHLAPTSRWTFVDMSLYYMSIQTGFSGIGDLVGMTNRYLAPHTADGEPKDPFSDDSSYNLTAAHALGLIQGRDDGTFHGEDAITRQEAATMLARAYTAMGGTLPAGDLPFSDAGRIDDWAKDSVAAMNALGVMQGLPNGAFDPDGTYSVEQCVVTFARLCDNPPVSRQHGNVKSLFTFQQANEFLPDSERFQAFFDERESFRLSGPLADLVRTDWHFPGHFGSGYDGTSFHLVRQDGSIHMVDFGVCDTGGTPSPNMKLTDPAFSADGKTFTCTILLTEDVTQDTGSGPEMVHPKGAYHVTLDVMTCAYQLQREDLPQS